MGKDDVAAPARPSGEAQTSPRHAEARAPSFARTLARAGWPALVREPVTTLQVNVGQICNLACHHCHVEAGPKRTEIMSDAVADRVIALMVRHPSVRVLDLTGGAPEMNANFRRFVVAARELGVEVIDRCNLTILLEPGYETLPEFLAHHAVQVVASLPCYLEENVDRQRGRGTFSGSIDALKRLNALGYGNPGTSLQLDLVYNPLGPSLPPAQATLEQQYRARLRDRFGIEFNRLLTITNMPIRRFAETLRREQRHDEYMSLLVNHFNPATVAGLMCRTLVSVGWDGALYDCDFNQMLDLSLGAWSGPERPTVWNVDSFDEFEAKTIATGAHCYGCTAGAGSSCSGALAS